MMVCVEQMMVCTPFSFGKKTGCAPKEAFGTFLWGVLSSCSLRRSRVVSEGRCVYPAFQHPFCREPLRAYFLSPKLPHAGGAVEGGLPLRRFAPPPLTRGGSVG